jgi:hypothetical protein
MIRIVRTRPIASGEPLSRRFKSMLLQNLSEGDRAVLNQDELKGAPEDPRLRIANAAEGARQQSDANVQAPLREIPVPPPKS